MSIFKAQIWDLKDELQHAYLKTEEQKEEIRNLQNTMSEAKLSLDQVVRERKIELQVKPTVYFSRNSLQEICNKTPLLNKLIINIFHEF